MAEQNEKEPTYVTQMRKRQGELKTQLAGADRLRAEISDLQQKLNGLKGAEDEYAEISAMLAARDGKQTSTRLTPARKQELKKQVLGILKSADGPMRSPDVRLAHGNSLSSAQMSRILKDLTDEGKLVTKGERAGMRYAVKT